MPSPRAIPLLFLLTGTAFGSAITCERAPLASDPESKAESTAEALDALRFDPNDLLPSFTERFFSGYELKWSLIDLEDFYYTEEELTRPGRETVNVFVRRPNPEPALFKLELTIDLATAVTSQDELNAAFGAATDRPQRGLTWERDERPERFFLQEGAGYAFDRFASAWTLSIGVSERPLLMNGEQRPDDLDDLKETYSIAFDPAKLPSRAQRVAKAITGLTAFSKIYGEPVDLGSVVGCGIGTTAQGCLREIARQDPWNNLLRVLLPAFKFETVDQFAYYQSGRLFLPLEGLEDSIETVSLIWDLGRVRKLREDRIALAKAAKAWSELKTRSTQMKTKPVIEVPGAEQLPPSLAAGDLVYLPLEVKGGLKDHTWCWAPRAIEACPKGSDARKQGLRLEKGGLLHGYLQAAAGEHVLAIQVQDALGRLDRLECTVTLQ